jgi:hypothetical protein
MIIIIGNRPIERWRTTMSMFNFDLNRCVVTQESGLRIDALRAYHTEGDHHYDGDIIVVTSGEVRVTRVGGGNQKVPATKEKPVRVKPL